MNDIKKNKMKLTTHKEKISFLKKSNLFLSMGFLLVTSLLVVFGCSPDETQTVTNFDNLVLEDDFATAGPLNATFGILISGMEQQRVYQVGVIMNCSIIRIVQKMQL